jgi:hypothetical protein
MCGHGESDSAATSRFNCLLPSPLFLFSISDFHFLFWLPGQNDSHGSPLEAAAGYSFSASYIPPVVALYNFNFLMPSSNHRRNLTWPPLIHVVDAEGKDDLLAQIDDDPFAYFLSAPLDEKNHEALAWSAGILDSPQPKKQKFTSSLSKKWAKLVTKQSHQLPTTSDEENEEYIWPEQDHKLSRLDWSPPHLKPQTLTHSPPPTGEAMHSRPHAQLRRETRRLSGHRRSWAAPSPEISTVLEEPEHCANMKGEDPVGRVDTPLIPEISLDGYCEVKTEEKTIEKKVHFKL